MGAVEELWGGQQLPELQFVVSDFWFWIFFKGFQLPGGCSGCPGELRSGQQFAGAAGAGREHGDAG